MGNKGDIMDSLDFIDMISTSNVIAGDQIIIRNSDPVLFCTTLNFADLWAFLKVFYYFKII